MQAHLVADGPRPLNPVELLFTVAEANATLPELRPRVERLVDATHELERATDLEIVDDIPSAQREFAQALEDVVALGVVVKDVRQGLCDFAADRDGEPVYLCWMLGEPSVAHWHSRHGGFAGRQPL